LTDLDLLRRIAATNLPYRLRTPEELAAAKALMAAGYVKLALPVARGSKAAYGKPDEAVVSAVTLAGKRALGT
jgi:hypothetical protein